MGFTTGLGHPTNFDLTTYYIDNEDPPVPNDCLSCCCDGLHAFEGMLEFNLGAGNPHIATNPTYPNNNGYGSVPCASPAGQIGIAATPDKAFTVAMWVQAGNADAYKESALVSRGQDAANREFEMFFDDDNKLIFRCYDEDSAVGINYQQVKTDAAVVVSADPAHCTFLVGTYTPSDTTNMVIYVNAVVPAQTRSEVGTYDRMSTGAVVQSTYWGKSEITAHTNGTVNKTKTNWSTYMRDMAMWYDCSDMSGAMTAGTVTDLYNSGKSYIYPVLGADATTGTTWIGPSDYSYGVHYTDQSTSGAVDMCHCLQVYYPGELITSIGGAAGPQKNAIDYSCNECDGLVNNVTVDNHNFNAMWTPNNVSNLADSTKTAIWLKRASGITGNPVSQWANIGAGTGTNHGADVYQGTSAQQPPAVAGVFPDFDGTADNMEFQDGSGSNLDIAIAAQEGLTIFFYAEIASHANNRTILSSGSGDAHFLQYAAGGSNILLKLGTTTTTITPVTTGLFNTSATHQLLTLRRDAGATGTIAIWQNGASIPLQSSAANPGDGEFDTLGMRSSDEYYHGQMMEVVMMTRALSNDEITEANEHWVQKYGL
jgi:hypothetical protein